MCSLTTMKACLIQHGRKPKFQIWKGHGERIPHMMNGNEHDTMEIDLEVKIQSMLQIKFEQADDPTFEGPIKPNCELGTRNIFSLEILHEQTRVAFEVVDNLENEVVNDHNNSSDEEELLQQIANF